MIKKHMMCVSHTSFTLNLPSFEIILIIFSFQIVPAKLEVKKYFRLTILNQNHAVFLLDQYKKIR